MQWRVLVETVMNLPDYVKGREFCGKLSDYCVLKK
jgi:hypothetical protein